MRRDFSRVGGAINLNGGLDCHGAGEGVGVQTLGFWFWLDLQGVWFADHKLR